MLRTPRWLSIRECHVSRRAAHLPSGCLLCFAFQRALRRFPPIRFFFFLFLFLPDSRVTAGTPWAANVTLMPPPFLPPLPWKRHLNEKFSSIDKVSSSRDSTARRLARLAHRSRRQAQQCAYTGRNRGIWETEKDLRHVTRVCFFFVVLRFFRRRKIYIPTHLSTTGLTHIVPTIANNKI